MFTFKKVPILTSRKFCWDASLKVARPLCFLLSDAVSYITGQHLSTNGGYTIDV